MNDTTDEKPPSKRQQRQVLEAVKIYTTPPTANDLAFIAREFILCTLPLADTWNNAPAARYLLAAMLQPAPATPR